MSEVTLFRYDDEHAEEYIGATVELERDIQRLVEKHMESFFGVRFVATEHPTGQIHGGRIDSLGLASDGSPVIFEYKRHTNDNIVSQALYYRTWLLDHRGDFQVLVHQNLGADATREINWTNPRIICIAGDFTKFDEHAVQQINQPIELVRYRLYGDDLVMFDWIIGEPSRRRAAPGLAPVSNPDNSDTKARASDSRSKLRRFLDQLLEHSNERTRSHRAVQPGASQYLNAPSSVNGLYYTYTSHMKSTRVDFLIRRPDAGENLRLLEQFQEHKAEIERSFGGPLEWETISGYVPCRVSSTINAGGYSSNEDDWPKAIQATVDEMVRLQNAFQPYLDKMED